MIVKKRIKGKQAYYYLEHSVREGKKVEKVEKYLGKKLPGNIEGIKREFIYEIYRKRWTKIFDKIRDEFSKEQGKTPESAKLKDAEDFMIRFTYDTNRIEGSTLTLRETADLLERGVTPKGKSIDDVKETEAHKKVFYDMLGYDKNLSMQIVLYWHKQLLGSTKSDIAGKIRQHQVRISGSRFTPPFPAEIEPLLKVFFEWYAKNKNKLHPVELAALVHLKFVTIHPFADGNGRISRLMVNSVLNKLGFPMLNVHYENRTAYYNALERAQMKDDETVFLRWFFKKYVKEQKRYLKNEITTKD